MCQYGYMTPALSESPWWGEINLEGSGCGGNEHKMYKKGWKWVKLGENAIHPAWKKHSNLLVNNNDAQSITKYGFLVRPHAQIVALCAHCVRAALKDRPLIYQPLLSADACQRENSSVLTSKRP